MNPLANNPKARKIVYHVFWALGIILGATQVGYASADAGSPEWLVIVLAVYGFLAGAVGYTAAKNTPKPDDDA